MIRYQYQISRYQVLPDPAVFTASLSYEEALSFEHITRAQNTPEAQGSMCVIRSGMKPIQNEKPIFLHPHVLKITPQAQMWK